MNAWIKRTINRLGNWLFGPPVPPIAEFNKLVELGRLGGWAMIERHLWSEDARTRYIAMFRAYEYADTGDESLIESLDAKNRQLAKEMLLPIVMREKREREEAIACLRETVKAIEERYEHNERNRAGGRTGTGCKRRGRRSVVGGHNHAL